MTLPKTSRELAERIHSIEFMRHYWKDQIDQDAALIDAFVAEAVKRESEAALECVSSSISEVNDDDPLTARLLRRLERRLASANAALAATRAERMQPAGEANDRS